MTDNPYRTPPSESVIPAPKVHRGPAPTREARLKVLAVLLFASLITARILHSGDLYSLFIASIPIFLLSVVAYYFGLRHGTKA